MKAICGVDCCSECGRKDECKGCIETDGHPFGGRHLKLVFLCVNTDVTERIHRLLCIRSTPCKPNISMIL